MKLKILPQTHCNETIWYKDYPDELEQCSRKKPFVDENHDWKCWQHQKKEALK